MSTATALTAAQKAAIIRSLDGVLPEDQSPRLHEYLFTTLPALILSDVANQLQSVASLAAMKALTVGTLGDKALVFAEDVGQLFQYDADSAAAEALGPPATVVAPTTGTGRYIALTLGFGATPQSYVDARLRLVADVAAVKAIVVATLVDKALVFVEGTGQFFNYDSGSVAVEALGPPATVIQPTAGAGRYLVFVGTTTYADAQAAAALLAAKAYGDARLRSVADTAALKAVDVTTLVDKAVIFVESLNQLFSYDADSATAEALGPPVSVIQPTAGAGRYIARSNPPAALPWFTAVQGTDPAAGDNLPAGADGTFANSNRCQQRAPCKGIVKAWYVGEANPVGIDDANTAVLKVIAAADSSALVTKTFNTATQPGNAFVPTLLGSFAVAEGDLIGWEVITGAAADLPKFSIQFDVTPVA